MVRGNPNRKAFRSSIEDVQGIVDHRCLRAARIFPRCVASTGITGKLTDCHECCTRSFPGLARDRVFGFVGRFKLSKKFFANSLSHLLG